MYDIRMFAYLALLIGSGFVFAKTRSVTMGLGTFIFGWAALTNVL